MENAKLYYLVDVALFVLIATSFISARIESLKELHELSGNLLALLVAVHLYLHRRWIISMTKNIFKKQ